MYVLWDANGPKGPRALEDGELLNWSRKEGPAQDDVQAVRHQIRKARGTWARVGQVLRGKNAAPRVAAKFYKAVVQSVLLYGSETWNLTETVQARLEGFHIRAAYRMARVHKPRKGLLGNWIYPSTKDVLEECGLHSVKEYINTRRATIAMYVVNRPIFQECQEGERRRESMPRRWWWEQELSMDV
jgi:hypothetical protein